MQIINHRLHKDDGTPFPYRESPNRGGPLQAQYLIMHYTASPSAQHAINWLCNPLASASAHVVVGRDGAITQLVPFNVVAWHAGKSEWNGLVGLNTYSIGIELDNAGPLTWSGDRWVAWFGTEYPREQVIEAVHKHGMDLRGWHLYTPEQLFSALELSSLLAREYHLTDVLGHEDIAPGRKTDPGPAFPMLTFRARLFGRADVTAEPPPPAPQLFRTTANLNIRTGPGSQYQVLKGSPLPKGTRLQILASDSTASWRQVNVLDTVNGIMDLQGWVHSNYVEPMPG